MKTIIIVQTALGSLESIKKSVGKNFPQLKEKILYDNNFESALTLIPKEGEVIVITSNFFHDKNDILFNQYEKNGNKMAEEVKKINPASKIYAFSTDYLEEDDHIDGFYQKIHGGWEDGHEIIEIFYDLSIVERPKKTFWDKLKLTLNI